jgi:hypothetical protein
MNIFTASFDFQHDRKLGHCQFREKGEGKLGGRQVDIFAHIGCGNVVGSVSHVVRLNVRCGHSGEQFLLLQLKAESHS